MENNTTDILRLYHAICDVEHEGDIENGRYELATAMNRAGYGRITGTRWSGEDGDDAYILYEIPRAKREEFAAILEKVIDGED